MLDLGPVSQTSTSPRVAARLRTAQSGKVLRKNCGSKAQVEPHRGPQVTGINTCGFSPGLSCILKRKVVGNASGDPVGGAVVKTRWKHPTRLLVSEARPQGA